MKMICVRGLLAIVVLFAESALTHTQAHAQTHVDTLVALGLQSNAALMAQQLHIEEAELAVEAESVLPKATITSSFGIIPVETREGPVLGKISAMQPIPWFGVLQKQVAASEHIAEVRSAEYRVSQHEFIYKLQVAFAEAWYAQEATAIRAQEILLTQAYAKNAHTRYEQGVGRMVDVVRANMKLQQDTVSLANARREHKQRLIQLQYLVQNKSSTLYDSLVLPDISTAFDSTSKPEQHVLVALSKTRIGALKARAHALEATDAPTVLVGVEYSVIDSKMYSGASSGGTDALGVSLGLTLPLLGQRGESAAEAQLIAVVSTEQQKAQDMYQIASEFEAAKLAFESNLSEQDVVSRLIEQTQLSLQLTIEEYSNNGSEFEQILDVQRDLLELQMRAKKLRAEQVKLWAKIEFWRGG